MVESEVELVYRHVGLQQQEPLDFCSALALLAADLVLCSDALATAALQPGGKNLSRSHVKEQSFLKKKKNSKNKL